MGAGHSGSTILGLTLGNCANILFAGELSRWLPRGGRSRFPNANRSRFWAAVAEQVKSTAAVSRHQARLLERSSPVLSPTSRRERNRAREPYRRITEDLYYAIARTTEATHIVDTSHFPRRARELQALDGIDLYLIFLVRQPQSVVASYGRKNIPDKQTVDMPRTNGYLWLTYMRSLAVFLRHPREQRLFVRHEAFLADPEGVLEDIFTCIGSSVAVPDLAALETGVAFYGNRLIKADVVTLKARPEKPSRGSRMTALVQLPWNFIFARLGPAARTVRSSGSN